MTSASDLAVIRRAFARQITHKAAIADSRIEAAFAALPRETFLGPGPWQIMHVPEGYRATPDDDPALLYQDVPVSILADRRLNNGQPSFLAALIDLCAVREGDRVVHVGTGTGYYTAVLAHLAGGSGRVSGVELEAELAERAARNLATCPNTEIVCGDGWTQPLGPADAILVNAGAPSFASTWLDALKPGGRLVVPLGTTVEHDGRPMMKGAIIRVVRDDRGYAASCTWGTMIYPCIGAGDPQAETALKAAFETNKSKSITRLRRGEIVDDKRCWLRGTDWALTFD